MGHSLFTNVKKKSEWTENYRFTTKHLNYLKYLADYKEPERIYTY